MVHWSRLIEWTPFSRRELAAAQASRPGSGTTALFTEREIARLQFLRWLARRPARSCTSSRPATNRQLQCSRQAEPATDDWLSRLKAGYDAGYYKTEVARGEQSQFAWQNKNCRDCPFWTNCICQVYAAYRSPTDHTCSYFDPWNRPAAKAIVQERQWQGLRRWWERFNGADSTQ